MWVMLCILLQYVMSYGPLQQPPPGALYQYSNWDLAQLLTRNRKYVEGQIGAKGVGGWYN